jgi:hypothetical protein
LQLTGTVVGSGLLYKIFARMNRLRRVIRPPRATLPPPSEDGTGRDKPSVISCVLVRDESPTKKNSNMHDRLYCQQFYDAPRTTVKNYFAPLTISMPAASTISNIVNFRPQYAEMVSQFFTTSGRSDQDGAAHRLF